MKTLLFLALGVLSTQAFSAVITKDLNEVEAQLAAELAYTYTVPVEVHRTLCSKQTFDIVGRVRGFNGASWTISSPGGVTGLSNKEIAGVIPLVDRLEVPLTVVDPITTETRVTLEGVSCDFVSMGWTVSFDDQK